jgi:hypothetical protein
MCKEKRKGEWAPPYNLEDVLNEMQLITLRRIEGFGWELRFVRRPLFEQGVPVVFNGEGDTIGILEDDGRLNLQPGIEYRGSVNRPGFSGDSFT